MLNACKKCWEVNIKVSVTQTMVLEKLENCLHLHQVLLSMLQSDRGVLAAPRHVHIGLIFIKLFSMQSKSSQKKLNSKVLLENHY